jgi:hypothetical protein
MRRTKVDQQGNVRCPKCGATGGFVQKRTIKGKIGFGILAPKRLKCLGCGAMMKGR